MLKRSCWMLVLLLFLSGAAQAAVIAVDTSSDADAADGRCSLREAILAANTDQGYQECPAGDGPDRIIFSLSLLPTRIELTADLPTITDSLRISGPGLAQLALDGDDSYRPFWLNSTTDDGLLIVEDLTVSQGFSGTTPGANSGGAVFVGRKDTAVFRRVYFLANRSDNGGGAIYVVNTLGPEDSSFLTLEGCLLEDNLAEGVGGGGAVSGSTHSQVQIYDSTFVDNQAVDGIGGAIRCSRCSLQVERSTISGNESHGSGGGIAIFSNAGISSSFMLRDSTVTGNTSGTDSNSGGGGISLQSNDPTLLQIENSVIAENTDSTLPEEPDLRCLPSTQLVETGFSFIGINSGCTALFPAGNPNGDQNVVGSAASPLDPGLDILRDVNGATPVHLPLTLPLSPLIDQGYCPEALLDQRGYGGFFSGVRIVDEPVPNPPGGDGCDIGAVEINAEPIPHPEVFSNSFDSGTMLFWSSSTG